ncbi:MAG: sigma factor-like helix-turn-helix DNA-binding protein [Armatimonadota bacterium]
MSSSTLTNSAPVYDLESLADRLLASSGALQRGTGVYMTRQLRRRIRYENTRLPGCRQPGLPSEVTDYLFYQQVEELIEASSLSFREELVFRLYLYGFSMRETAEMINRSRAVVRRLIAQARHKLQAAYAQGRYAGWYEVYLSEVNRPVYRHR